MKLSPRRLRAPLVFLAAFALRAAFLLQWLRLPYLGALNSDAWSYDRWAMAIARGGLVRSAAFSQSPLYPYLLGGVYRLFGHHVAGALWLQVLADSLTCVLAMRLGERAFGERAGLWTGLLAAFYRPLIFAAAVPGKETLAVLAAAALALLALRAAESGRRRDYFLAGLACGLGALLRTNMLLLLPAALLWAWPRRRAAFWKSAVLPSALGCALAVLPAALHNWAASRDFVLITSNGGYTFYLGNNPCATGTLAYPPGFSSNPLLEESQSAAFAEKAEGRQLKPSEVSRFWLRRGLAFISAEPARWAVLTLKKLWLFWNRYEIPDNYDVQFVAGNFRTVLGWPLASFALAGSLGALGLFFCRPRGPSGLLLFLFLAYLASLLPFLIEDRYRLPALAFLLPLAGGGLEALITAAGRRSVSGIRRQCLYAAPLVFVCLSPPPFDLKFAEGAGWGRLAAIYASEGRPREALEAFRRAAGLDPESLNQSAVYAAAVSLAELGDPEGALKMYGAGLAAIPGSALLAEGRGELLLRLGRKAEGVKELERAVRLDPEPGEEFRPLFYACLGQGLEKKALDYGRRALSFDPGDAALARDLAALELRAARGRKGGRSAAGGPLRR